MVEASVQKRVAKVMTVSCLKSSTVSSGLHQSSKAGWQLEQTHDISQRLYPGLAGCKTIQLLHERFLT